MVKKHVTHPVFRELITKEKKISAKSSVVFLVIFLGLNLILYHLMIPMATIIIDNLFIGLVFLIHKKILKSKYSEERYDEFIIFFKDLNSKINGDMTFQEGFKRINPENFQFLGHYISYIQEIISYVGNYKAMEELFSLVKDAKINKFKGVILQHIKNSDYDFNIIVKSIENEDKLDKSSMRFFIQNKSMLYLTTILVVILSGLSAYVLGYNSLLENQLFIHSYLFISIVSIFLMKFKPITQRYLYDMVVLYFWVLLAINLTFIITMNFQRGFFG